jgi:hypothetical protein
MHLLKEKTIIRDRQKKLNMQCEKGKNINTNSFKQNKPKQSNIYIKKVKHNLI